jgi:hypothetical protein
MGVAHPVRSPLDRASPIHHAARSQGYSPLNEYQGGAPGENLNTGIETRAGSLTQDIEQLAYGAGGGT